MSIELDNSQLSCYMTCPMKYYITYGRNLKKRAMDETNIDRAFGEYVHKSMEIYQRTGDKDFDSHWTTFTDLPVESKEFCKTKANGIVLCKAYIDHYSKIDTNMEILDIEALDKIEINSGLTWVVKVDNIIKINNNIYFKDYKTTGRSLDGKYFSQFNPNTQFTGYALYTKNRFGQCSGGIVDAIKCGYRQRAYKGEPAGFHYEFRREIVNRNKEQIEDFKENVSKWAAKIEYSNNNLEYCKNETACTGFRGCPFREICMTSKGIDLDMQIVDTLYEVTDNKKYLTKGESNE